MGVDAMSDDIYVLIEHIHGHLLDISQLLLTVGREYAEQSGGQVKAIYIGSKKDDLVEKIAADQLLVFEHEDLRDFLPDHCIEILFDLIEKDPPRLLLLGETTIGADIAGRLSVRSGMPAIGKCRRLDSGNGTPAYTCSICGGKILVTGPLPETTTIVCMIPGGYQVDEQPPSDGMSVEMMEVPRLTAAPVQLKEYIEPEVGAVDITREPVLVAVGRGIQREDNIELAEDLATHLNGRVCASRPVVDQGWLPTSQMVGKSGKVVKPKLYLALGISGAPEHLEGMSESDLIVAVNTDPGAPIFEIADYGVEMDLFDLIPALIEKL
jgi:electron transfer flavoprotein alpha subunit